MFTYEFDFYTKMAETKEDGFPVAQINIDTEVFEQIGGDDDMSDGEIEMHCEGMMEIVDNHMRIRRSYTTEYN